MNLTRTIKTAALLLAVFWAAVPAKAAGEAMFSKGHSTWTVSGIDCTSVATNITGSLDAFDITAYRLTNLDTSVAVFIGHDALVSNDTTSARVGEKLTAGSNGVWEIGKNPDLAQALVKIWCRSASGTVRLARAIFGSK